MSEKIVLIDGHSILNRAFYGVPDLTNSEGLHTNAIYGFLNILFKILDEEHPDYLTVAFDRSEPTFRHKMYAEYKGTRKPMAEELRQQIPVMKDVLHAMGVVTVEQPGLEADDILGTISRSAEEAGLDVRVISGDRDLLQLATDKVMIRIPKTKKTGTEIEDYFAADVLARYQVTPTEFIDVKALMGDSSDNIPGVPGIGEKGATNIISTYKSIENAYAHVAEIKPKRAQTALAEHYDMAQMSKELATIEVHADISYDMEAARMGNLFTPEAYVWFKRLEFKQMLTRFEKKDGEDEIAKGFQTITSRVDADAFFDELCASLNGQNKKKPDSTNNGTECFDKKNAFDVEFAKEKPLCSTVASALVAYYLEEAGKVYGVAVGYFEPTADSEGNVGQDTVLKESPDVEIRSKNRHPEKDTENGFTQLSLFDSLQGGNVLENGEGIEAKKKQDKEIDKSEENQTQVKKDGKAQIVYLQCNEEISPAYLDNQLQKLCDICTEVIAPDIKALLKHVSLEDKGVLSMDSQEANGVDFHALNNADGNLCLNEQNEVAVNLQPKECREVVCEDSRLRVIDINLAAYLLNPLKNEYSYDDIAKDYLGEMIPAKTDLFGKLKLAKAVKEKPEAVAELACYTVYTALKAKDALMQALAEQGMDRLYREVELPLVFVLDDMEKTGIRADGAALTAYGQKLSGRIGELEQSIYERAGEEFNINSPKQLGVILFEKMKLPNGKKTKTGYSTAADVLEKLAPEHEIVSEILEYRQLTKLKSTYADGLVPCIAADGRIHSTFNQTITATGRLSSTDPNLQNIPVRMELGRLIRKVFIPKDGYVFIDADYSQIELRVLAHMSEDENLISAYRHAEDIHRITASQVFHVAPEDVTPLQRRNAKAVNFGIVYGISSFGLSQDLSISRKEAGEYIENYFATFPGIKKFLDGAVADAREKGYAKTLFGRRRPVPELKSGNFMQRQFGERIAMNSPIQGTAADIIKIAMIRVYRRLKADGLWSRLILQVHDELLIETAPDEMEQVKTILGEEMRHAADLSVDLEVDMKVGGNWFEAH